ncbi:Lrp/AsnC family transcriptional regulator [Jatrophihabitans endophyticus]|uniref:Lrp/AsnC family transcriptional regulator n=1 Tax=Jatrophihabitans endophyticus TaxID=1206085 RepID=UPI001A0A5F8C|nr:Lrp/AsnC family transcriptional regulator [Jatrophihabitans endophyticus]MBE7189247.1 Lrp/AsnC family transcriptional regulator [Jatrophihabitans endophyticus]
MADAASDSAADQLDRAIIRGLQLSPRVAFSTLARVLNVSEQTVARRYRRLRRAGLVRVTAVVSPEALGESNWIVRIDCRPTGATSLAQALAQREDVGWVSVSAGGTQVLCTVRSRTAAEREDLLLQRLPRSTQVLAMSAAMVLHRFLGGAADDWAGIDAALTAEQEQALRRDADRAPATFADLGVARLDDVDTRMLTALVADGRASLTSLAAAGGISEGRADRRLASLLGRGIAYLDVDVPIEAFGYRTVAHLWLSVSPAHLDGAGRELATCPEVAFVGAITGTHNLYAAVLCRSTAALYRFVTERVGAIKGITSLEVAPVIRTVKQADSLLSEGRLAPDPAT